ncbi:MAG: ABC transporter ATP-binding protein [Acidobacteriia bacterium]|nr:ABC transporter ATP-binding protein [Terriglobia bacterium]
MNSDAVISVQGLQKSYGGVEAVKGIDFEVRAGEIFGILGPNGAGKTTTVEILEGLRPRTGGSAAVLGFDPEKQTQQLKDRIGVCLQATNLPAKMRTHEALDLFASFYTRSVSTQKLLDRLQLAEKRNAYYETLSGGQKQRLALAMALVNDPQLLFLDEPTTGLDPQIRLEIHRLIEELRAEKRTVVLTTHYLEEAERLCDRVAIMDEGRIVAMGTPRELQQKSRNQSVIQIVCEQPIGSRQLPEWPDAVSSSVDGDGRSLTVHSGRPARTLVEIMKWLDQQGLSLEDIHLHRPTLEDVFVELTGKRLRE